MFRYLLPLLLLLNPESLLPAACQSLPAALVSATTPPVAWADHTRLLPEKLRGIPTGLRLTHSPALVYPMPDAQQPGHYRWHHRTTVRTEVGPLEIVECGSFIWYSAAGWQANICQSPADFAALFHCPGGRLQPGKAYTFPTNDRTAASAAQLYPGDALWYVLARDPRTGLVYKGLGLVETEAGPR